VKVTWVAMQRTIGCLLMRLYRYRMGIPWRDLPARFGDWKIVHQRFSRWARSGVFALESLTE
jgi:transposase